MYDIEALQFGEPTIGQDTLRECRAGVCLGTVQLVTSYRPIIDGAGGPDQARQLLLN